MDEKKLFNLLLKKEGPKLDYKLKIDASIESGKKELAKDICAIANSRGGRGYLVLGVEDKTKALIGVDPEILKEEQLQQIVSSRCEPPIPVSIEYVNYKNVILGVINIFDGHQKPYQLRDNGAFYVRRGSTTDTMRKHEIMSAMEENITFNAELCPIISSDVGCLDKNLVDMYFNRHNIQCDDTNRIYLMESASIIKFDKESSKHVATLGGVLVFSKINYLYVPHNMIKIVNKINNKTESVVTLQGDLINLLNKSMETISEIFPREYPVQAIYEAIENAVLYRDYNIFFKEIEVVINKNSTSVTSPGILLKDQSITPHNYTKRNMWIYEKINTLGNEKLFFKNLKGFSKMKKAFKKFGNIQFVNSIENQCFKVIFPGIDKFKGI